MSTYVISDIHGALPQFQKPGEFESTIYISNGNMRANAKSLMGMLSMQLDPARPVVITAEGADEAAACEAMEEYIRSQM